MCSVCLVTFELSMVAFDCRAVALIRDPPTLKISAPRVAPLFPKVDRLLMPFGGIVVFFGGAVVTLAANRLVRQRSSPPNRVLLSR